MARYRDRHDAGRQLAEALAGLRLHRPVVLALPRGGVPVGAEVAAALRAPLEVVVARKLGAPGHPELGIGAIAEGLEAPVVTDVARQLGVGAGRLADLARREHLELDRRVHRYRGDRPLPDLTDRDVLVVDDGLATGVTAEATLRALRALGPRRLVLAVPVGAPDAVVRLGALADEVVCPLQPPGFQAVGRWYDVFDQTSDDEVLATLDRARASAAHLRSDPDGDGAVPGGAERDDAERDGHDRDR